MSTVQNHILDARGAAQKLERMALEIVENNFDEKEIILAGIREKGVVVAAALKKILEKNSTARITSIGISLDKNNPGKVSLSETPGLDDRVVIIVDDVVNSGKTLTWAMKPFLEYHPKKIQILVLVERTHTHFPVRPDYVGLSIATTLQEHIVVNVEGGEIRGAQLR
jgi:pyrimidine operon attenuation protein/uracil phosphoribosyltransferase